MTKAITAFKLLLLTFISFFVVLGCTSHSEIVEEVAVYGIRSSLPEEMVVEEAPDYVEEYRDDFEDFEPNPVILTSESPVSTFSADVDTVAIVVYAGAEGIQLAYQLAEENFKAEAVNRILLATDGDFNVGISDREQLKGYIERKRDAGIYLSILGFGQGNYRDHMMQTLAQNGNGIAAYIDTLSEAQKVLVHEATSSLFPIATDLKLKVEFNPKTVSEYRLLGYETRALKREDFNNDKVDAGDIGSGHSVTAIYEVALTGAGGNLVEELRYSDKTESENASNLNDELACLKIRYKLPGEQQSVLREFPIYEKSTAAALDVKLMQQEVNFATAVAGFSQLLTGGKYLQDWNYDDALKLAQENKGEDEYGYRSEFVQLVRKAKVAKDMDN